MTQGKFSQVHAVPQPTNFVPGNSYRLSPSEGGSHARTCTGHSAARVPSPLKAFQRILGLMASASSVLQLGLLDMWPLQYWLKPRVPPHAWRHGRVRVKMNQACVAALAPWTNYQWIERGVPLGMVYRRKVVLIDASNLGWGALCDGKPAFVLWS